MASFLDCVEIAYDNFTNPETRERAIMLSGPPGCAKTSMGRVIAQRRELPMDRVVVLTPGRINPVNVMGMPDTIIHPTEGYRMMTWAEPEDMHLMSDGPWVLVIDEVGQCGPMMQGTMGGIMLDRGANKVKLSPEVSVLATTNRVEDKAGSKPIMTHTGNRVMFLEMEYGFSDFLPYGIDSNLDPLGLAYLQFAPQHLFEFDPDRTVNATARSWDYALRVNTRLPKHLYQTALSGIIPPGIAADYVSFRDIVARLPNPDDVRRNPNTAPIPREVNILYALIANLIVNTQTATEFDHLMIYIARLPIEFQTLYVHTCIKRVPTTAQSPLYIQWINTNHEVFGGTK